MAHTPLQIDLDRIVRKFVSLASEIVSKNIIPGNDNHPSPSGSYATVLEITKRGSGIDSETVRPGPTSTEATLKHKGRRSITYSVQFYRDGAADNIESLLSYAATTPGQIYLGENDLTWGIASDITNLDSVINSKFEYRRAVDITFRYQSRRTLDINNIGSVEIDFTLSAESDINEIIEVTDA